MNSDKYDYESEYGDTFDRNGVSDIIDALDAFASEDADNFSRLLYYKFFGGMSSYSVGDTILDSDMDLIQDAENLLNNVEETV